MKDNELYWLAAWDTKQIQSYQDAKSVLMMTVSSSLAGAISKKLVRMCQLERSNHTLN